MNLVKFLIATILMASAVSAEAQSRRARKQTTDYTESTETTDSYLYAGAYKHEVAASMTSAEIQSANSNTIIAARGTYKYTIGKAMQVGGIAELGMNNTAGNNSTSISIWGTFTYNFNQSWNVSDSFYATLGLGLAQAPGSEDRKFSYMVMAGKRFPIFDKVLYTPEAGFQKVGDADMAIVIIPLNISIVF